MRIFGWMGSVAVLGLLALATTARADEEKVPLKDVPKAVLDAIKAKFPAAELKTAEKEEEDGKTIFEVAFTHGGQKYEVEAKPDGTIVVVDRELTAKDLPQAVLNTVQAKYPGAKIEKAEEVTEDGKVSYEVEIETAADKDFEILLDVGGKILKTEEKGEKD